MNFFRRLFLAAFAERRRPPGGPSSKLMVELVDDLLGQVTFPAGRRLSVLGLIPDVLLDNEKLRLLSRNQIEKVLLQKLEHLQTANNALTQAQRQSVRNAQQLREVNLELAASNEELQKTLRVQEEFTSIVSHELRTPLTAIVGASTILIQREGALPAQKVKQLLEMIVAESWRLSRLVGEILDLSRIQKKGISLHYEPLSLPDKDATNYKTPGTGLGRTITKAIVEAMGGHIQVSNNQPHGCIMTVILPSQPALSDAA